MKKIKGLDKYLDELKNDKDLFLTLGFKEEEIQPSIEKLRNFNYTA